MHEPKSEVKGACEMLLVIILLITFHSVFAFITLRTYRMECLITNCKPDIINVVGAMVPFTNLLIIYYSMKKINKVIPEKPTLAELLLGIKREHYWSED